MAADPTVFQFVGQSVTAATEAFVEPATQNLIQNLQGLALIMVALYILLQGLGMATGLIQAPVKAFMKSSFKIVFVTSIALSANNYGAYVVAAVGQLELGLAEAMGVGGTTPASIYVLLDQTLGKGLDVVALCIQLADETPLRKVGTWVGWWFCCLIVLLGTAAVVVMGGVAIIIAKFAISIMFALGPFFILLLIWPATARFFDSWFSQVMNYTVLIVIMAVIMTFALAMFERFVTGDQFTGEGGVNPIYAAGQIGVLSWILVYLIREARSMAAGLAGGLSMSALSMRDVLAPARGAAQAVNGASTRRDMQSGHMTTAGRLNHVVAGNTPFNPAYLQHVRQQIGKNWGRSKGGSASK